MSAPNAAGAGLTSPTPLSPSWLVRRSALLRSPDCARASPEPVKAAVATRAAATSATAAVVSDDRFFRNVILLSSLRHGAGSSNGLDSLVHSVTAGVTRRDRTP